MNLKLFFSILNKYYNKKHNLNFLIKKKLLFYKKTSRRKNNSLFESTSMKKVKERTESHLNQYYNFMTFGCYIWQFYINI